MAAQSPVPATLIAGEKEVELVMGVPPCGPEPLLTDPLELIVAQVGEATVLAVGVSGDESGWGAADLGTSPEAAARAAEEGAVTVVLRDVGGTDMAGRPHDVVMGFRSVALALDVAEAVAGGAGAPPAGAGPPPLAAIRAGAVATQTTE